jgi:hypothetical protein
VVVLPNTNAPDMVMLLHLLLHQRLLLRPLLLQVLHR